MNIQIQTGNSALSDFVFRAADRMRIDGCANAVAREGLSLVLYCPFEALLDHYTGLLLNRVRQQAPEHSIEVYFPANTDSLLGRFNEVLSDQSVNQATKTPLAARQAQIWIVHDAHKLPESEVQLLARLIQNFPGANIRAILLMSGHATTPLPLSAFGRKILRWDIDPPSEEQAQAALAQAQHDGQFTAVHQLLQRIQPKPDTTLATPALLATAAETAQAQAPRTTTQAPARLRMAAFHEKGLRSLQAARGGIQTLAKAPAWVRQHAKLSMAVVATLAASTLVMLWLQPEAFGLNSLKSNKPSTVKALALPGAAAVAPPTAPASQVQALPANNAAVSANQPAAMTGTPAGQTRPEPAIEAPDAAMQSHSWVRSLDPNSFLIQYGTSNTYEKIVDIQRKYPELKDSRIVAAYRPGEKLAHFVIVSGPYNPVTQGYEAAKRPGLPPGSWVRSTRNLQDQLKAPASTTDAPR